MTPFESLLWNVWLPKVRTCVNNDWSPKDPQPAVQLYETWSSFLPAFIRDNFLDQLILPKVQKAVADWNPRKDNVPLQALVFPWLPHVGLRLEDLMGDARRKVKSLLRTWTVGEEIPTDLVTWKEASGVLPVTICCTHNTTHQHTGFRFRRLGRDASQIRCAQARNGPSRRL
jgi:tuftelin-interacting protein 11